MRTTNTGHWRRWQRLASAAVVWALLGLAPSVPQANDDPPQWAEVNLAKGRFSMAPPPDWVIPLAEQPEAMPAPLYFRLIDTQYRFAGEQGSFLYRRNWVDGTNTQQMQRECKQTFEFNPKFQSFTLHTYGLWRAGQRLDQMDKLVPRFLTSDSGASSIYTGQVSVLIEVPDCRPGDSVDYSWSVAGRNPVFGPNDHMVDQMAWPDLPVGLRHLSFSAPVDLPLHVDTLPQPNTKASRLGGAIVRTDEVKKGWRTVRFQDRGVPAQNYHDNRASGYDHVDLITASTFADWSAVRRWAQGLFALPQPPKSEPYRALVQALSRLPTEQERVAHALQWVQREIRYVSVALGENAYRPASPDEVLARRYGDCKDVTLLLTRVLREVGIETQPALMYTFNGRITAKFNAVPWFNHAVAVAWVQGRPYVLDATVALQPSRLEKMGAWHSLSQVMVVDGPHQGFLTVPPSADPVDRTALRDEVMQLMPDGRNGQLTIKVTLNGVAAERQRLWVRSTPKDQLLIQILKEVRQIYPNAAWEAEPSYQDHEKENRIEMRANFRVPDVLRRKPGGGYRYAFSNSELTRLLSDLEDSHRAMPLALQSEVQHMVFTHQLRLPKGWRVDETPYNETMKTAAFSVHAQRSRPTPNSMMDRIELNIQKDTVDAKEMAAYQNALRSLLDMETSYRVQR